MRSPQSFPSNSKHLRTKRVGRRKNRLPLVQILLLLIIGCIVFYQLEGYLRTPEAVLVLGGAPEREVFAAQFAQAHPHLPIWISSGSNPEYTEWVFAEAGIDPTRLHLDRTAEDTVTNFTTLVDTFQTQGIRSIYLITSDYHMSRAWIVGEIVLGSRGIDFKPVSVPSQRSPQSPESLKKTVRDVVRSILWVTTGHTGSSLSRFFH